MSDWIFARQNGQVNENVTRRTRLAALALTLACALAVFWSAAKGGFINWDDPEYVINNPAVIGASWSKAFSPASSGITQVLYHPLTILTYKIEFSAAGLNPKIYHITNIALHLANCALVYYFILLLENDAVAALLTALLFAVHPLRVESVAWISDRKDLLCCLFFMGTLLTYLRYLKSPGWKWLAASATLYAAALLSKPTITSGVFALFMLDWYRERGWSWRILAEKIPHLAACAATVLLTLKTGSFFLEPQIASTVAGFSPGNKLAFCGQATLFYLEKILFPVKLCALYPHISVPQGIVAYLPIAAFGAAIVLLFKIKARPYIFSFMFFGLLIAPLLVFPKILPADRYTYIPAIGIFCAAGMIFSRFYKKAKIQVSCCAAALLLALGWIAAGRVKVWNNSLTLWDDTISTCQHSMSGEKRPTSEERILSIAYANRGAANLDIKRYSEAAEDFSSALKTPSSWDTRADIYRRRAGADLALNKYDETISDLTNSLQADPNQPLLYNERGGLFIAKERYKQAIDDYTMAIRLAPEFVTAYINRGIAYGRSGKHEAALADFEKALALNPGDATALAGKSVAEKMLRASKPTGSG